MKRYLRIICCVLVAVVLLSSTAYASNIEPRASHFFTRYAAYLYKTSSTRFEVWFDVTATGTMTELGVSEVEVQRSSDGANWTTMRTYKKASYSQMIGTDTARHANCVTYNGTAGYYYRAYVTFYAKNSSGMGETGIYTTVLYLTGS